MDWFAQIAENMLRYPRTVGVSDLVDIAIIAYLIYRLLLLARKSRSGQLVKGILVVLIVMLVSSQVHLRMLNFLLNRAVEMGLLALVILFTPEIRQFLERMGSSKFGMFSHADESNELNTAITQTVQAYAQLSKDKVGALMVFERNIILEDCIKSGTVLDARVSSELFYYIPRFFSRVEIKRLCTMERSLSATDALRRRAACCPCPEM